MTNSSKEYAKGTHTLKREKLKMSCHAPKEIRKNLERKKELEISINSEIFACSLLFICRTRYTMHQIEDKVARKLCIISVPKISKTV